jgi:hypothetical protein
MKTFRLILVTILTAGIFGIYSFAQPSPVNTVLIDPAYPQVGQAITIYINANHYNLTTDNDTLSAWTGLITSASTDLMSNWLHNPIDGQWSNTSIILHRVADVNNDSVFQLDIPDIATFYPGVGSETVLRIAFIARGQSNHAVSGQTGNIYFEVFGTAPVAGQTAYPANPTENDRFAIDFNLRQSSNLKLADSVLAHPDMPVHVYTCINTNLGDWKHELYPWSTNNDANTCIKVSDSVYRFFIIPSARKLYKINSFEGTTGLEMILRPVSGVYQTDAFLVPVTGAPLVDFSSITSYTTYPDYPTVHDVVDIYVNGNNWDFHPGATLSAWTGLITSTSGDAYNDWKHNPIENQWDNLSVKLLNLNDSIRVFSVSNIGSFYNVGVDTETVFRIAFIARDSANGKVRTGAPGGGNYQTENIYKEIYNGIPSKLSDLQPTHLDANKPAVVTVDLKADGGIAGYSDTLYAHSGVLVNGSNDWAHVLAAWDVNLPKARLNQINDSVYRFYIFPSIRGFYGVNDKEIVDSVALIFRNKTHNTQSATIIVPVTDNTDTTTVVGIAENDASGIGVTVYPNPAQENLTFKFEKAENAIIQIYNVQGQLLYTENVSNQALVNVNIGELNNESSVLIYRVNTDTGSAFGRIIKLK